MSIAVVPYGGFQRIQTRSEEPSDSYISCRNYDLYAFFEIDPNGQF